jgi:flagellar biosynthetic protein FlhB
MAEGGSAAEDRTEAATPRRMQRAREQGRVAVSREVPVLASLAAGAFVLSFAAPGIAAGLAHRLSTMLARSGTMQPGEAIRMAADAMLRGAAPFVLAALAAGVACSVLQTGVMFNIEALQPSFGRISPRAGLKRMFGAESVVETAKSVAKVGIIGWACWQSLKADLPALAAAPFRDPRSLMAQCAGPVMHVMLVILAAQTVITVLDVFWVRTRHAREMRMSRQDIRDEQKETEGDPKIKGRIRQIRQLRARKRMMAAVPKATVVVTNPTHYAVALAYDKAAGGAPRVVAKGIDSMAARIREVATENRVPIVANPPLARALHLVPLDTDIPAEHYQAVAEIIAYVWRLSQSRRRPVS